jgi:hypothetical protein
MASNTLSGLRVVEVGMWTIKKQRHFEVVEAGGLIACNGR